MFCRTKFVDNNLRLCRRSSSSFFLTRLSFKATPPALAALAIILCTDAVFFALRSARRSRFLSLRSRVVALLPFEEAFEAARPAISASSRSCASLQTKAAVISGGASTNFSISFFKLFSCLVSFCTSCSVPCGLAFSNRARLALSAGLLLAQIHLEPVFAIADIGLRAFILLVTPVAVDQMIAWWSSPHFLVLLELWLHMVAVAFICFCLSKADCDSRFAQLDV